ncbi:MAG: PAS domain S-box protein [Nitrospirae bacterium]|nr:PAS domain S-box protein [Nitrospirota bacterium]
MKTEPKLRELLFLIGLIAAGLAGNYFNYELFFDIQFIFGGIFAMLALQIFGLRMGVLSAFIISSSTLSLWNHPWAMVIMTCEVFCAGLLNDRKKVDLVVADTLFWVCIGIPMIFLFYYGVMHLPMYNVAVSMMKQAVNGIANVLVARLVFMMIYSGGREKLFKLRDIFFNLLAFSILATSLLLLASQSRRELAETDIAIRGSLSKAAERTDSNLETWLKSNMNMMDHLAHMAQGNTVARMQQSIEHIHSLEKDLLRIGLLDRNATVVAFSPLVDDLGTPNIGMNYADRPFIPVLKKNLRTMLTEVEMGRVGAPRPRVAIVAPVVTGGQYSGYVIGVLDLGRLNDIIALNAKGQIVKDLNFILLDKKGRVIVTNRIDLKVMDVYNRPSGEIIPLAEGLYQWLPLSRKNISRSDRWKDSFYVAESRVGGTSEWGLILELPIAPVQQRIYEKYAKYLFEIFMLLMAGMAVAKLLSRRIASPLEALALISSDISAEFASADKIEWPSSNIVDLHILIENFRNMMLALAGQFREVQKMNEGLEQTIEKRTADLRESEERFRSMFEKVHVVALVIDPADGAIIDANTAATMFYGWSHDQLLSMKISQINILQAEDVRKEMQAAKTEQRSFFLFKHRRADGSIRDVEIYSGPIQAGGKTMLYSIVHDISERRQAEEKIKQLMNEQQVILQTAPIGISFIKNRRIIWTNPYVEKIFGYEPQELWGLSTRVLYVTQDDYERTGATGYAHIALGKSYSTELLLVNKQGETFWASLVGQAVNPNDPADGSIWMFQDITERRHAEDVLREKTGQLEHLTCNLEKQVEEEIAARTRNEQILIQQSKLAAMGEMLGAIAHQWRQPLNSLGMCVQNIHDAYIHGDLNRSYLDRTVQKSMDQIQHMSKTIDDFRNFFRPDKELSTFDTMTVIGEVLSLFSAQLTSNNIAFRLTCHTHSRTFVQVGGIEVCPEKIVEGYRNEFEHVILNLISNAQDSIITRRETVQDKSSIKGLMTFDFFNRDDNVIIEVGDNGTGIPDAVMPRIFEPYFTMKEQSKGTGIGLYMSKIIIEDHMKGSLTVKNGPGGAVFTIILRQAEKAGIA